LFSCRRNQDGGQWSGSEEERLILLRQAVLCKADYVEIEVDAADQIRPYPGCQRVISYTNLKETPADIADIYEEMKTKKPDVLKLTCKARTPEEAWPLVQLLAKSTIPTVVVGLGRPGLMLAILGRKIGAPWTLAALEKGMEAYPGQPTISDLENLYAYRAISKSTKLIGVTGMSEKDQILCGLLNAGFSETPAPTRCWPLQVGNWKLFRKIIEAVKLQGVAVEDDFIENVHEAAFLDEQARAPVQAADWMSPGDQGWRGSNLLGEVTAKLFLEVFQAKEPENPQPLKDKTIVVAGDTAPGRMVVARLKEQGALMILASKDRQNGPRLAVALGARFILWEAIYQTFHDGLIVAGEPQPEEGDDSQELILHPGYLRQGMVVVDLQAGLRGSKFLREAELRGCKTLTTGDLLVEKVRLVVSRVTGLEISTTPLKEKWNQWVSVEE
jgi:3-dehydroquinate dehydratase/shikimate dehydrogenase